MFGPYAGVESSRKSRQALRKLLYVCVMFSRNLKVASGQSSYSSDQLFLATE